MTQQKQYPTYEPNPILKRLIYFKAKMKMNKFAELVGVNRQTIWGLITGKLRASPDLAKRISDALDEDSRIVFNDNQIEYPKIKTAYEMLEESENEPN